MNAGVATEVVIVTRPGGAGQRLTERVTERGHLAAWWPAFDIGSAPDIEAARTALARLADYDLALFVSANAVRATVPLLKAPWPHGTIIGAVGAATRAAVDAELQPAGATLIAPDDDGDSGSEAFWRAWQAYGARARRVLLLRAADGRDWLTERFIDSGATVDPVATYTRRARQLSLDDVARLRSWVSANVSAVTVFSSSESVTALAQQVDSAAWAWLRRGTAIATHPRIAQRLATEGYARVINATFDDEAIIAKLESIHGRH